MFKLMNLATIQQDLNSYVTVAGTYIDWMKDELKLQDQLINAVPLDKVKIQQTFDVLAAYDFMYAQTVADHNQLLVTRVALLLEIFGV